MTTWQVIQEDLHKLEVEDMLQSQDIEAFVDDSNNEPIKGGRRALIEDIIIIISFSDGFDFDGGEIDSDEEEIQNHTLIYYIVLKINYTQSYIYTEIPNAHYGKRLTECDLSWGHSQLPTSMGPTTRLIICDPL